MCLCVGRYLTILLGCYRRTLRIYMFKQQPSLCGLCYNRRCALAFDRYIKKKNLQRPSEGSRIALSLSHLVALPRSIAAAFARTLGIPHLVATKFNAAAFARALGIPHLVATKSTWSLPSLIFKSHSEVM